jgi:hypothetical protein
MKTYCYILFFAAVYAVVPVTAQENSEAAPSQRRSSQPVTGAAGNYASDIILVSDAQQQALQLAQQMLAQGTGDHAALATAVKEMQRAQSALAAAKNSPDKLPAAIAAEQTAYQALLKATPREFRMARSRRSSGQNPGDSSGQPDQQQLEQLDLANEPNRYETERQATAPQNAQQREQTQTVDRLKELAQRQQDLNDRMRELQTALQAARTDPEREDIQQQLKRLADEQRQQLANVDDLRQQLAQSPNASSQSAARQQLDQTRQDLQHAAEELQNQSASQALAAGTRAQQQLDQTRQNLQWQTASQFSEQMRQMRSEARDLTERENEIARGLDSLNTGGPLSLDDSAPRRQLIQQVAQQQSALTNLLAKMRDVTEQAETTEPLLSKQLYDTLRRADQMHTENLLDAASQLTEHGFLPQASQAERAARTNVTEIADGVRRAADSVLGSQADAMRYAQAELDDLAQQVRREIGGTNSSAPAADGNSFAPGQSNRLARAAGNASAENLPTGQPAQVANHDSPGQENNPSQRGETGQQPSGPNDGESPAAATGDGAGKADRLRQFAERLGQGNRAANNGGPITGNDFVNWSDQLRDVETVLDPADLRNQLATLRDRVAALRGNYRERGERPDAAAVRQQILMPLEQVRVWVREELARQENASSLVPLDRDPVPENYSAIVRQYYEKLGSAQ